MGVVGSAIKNVRTNRGVHNPSSLFPHHLWGFGIDCNREIGIETLYTLEPFSLLLGVDIPIPKSM